MKIKNYYVPLNWYDINGPYKPNSKVSERVLLLYKNGTIETVWAHKSFFIDGKPLPVAWTYPVKPRIKR